MDALSLRTDQKIRYFRLEAYRVQRRGDLDKIQTTGDRKALKRHLAEVAEAQLLTLQQNNP